MLTKKMQVDILAGLLEGLEAAASVRVVDLMSRGARSFRRFGVNPWPIESPPCKRRCGGPLMRRPSSGS